MVYKNAVCERPASTPVDRMSGNQVCDRVGPGWYPGFKRVVEWTIALFLLLVAAPLIALMAALTKLVSPGPAFYCQTRLGLNGKPFWIYKIRTMRHDCEASTGAVWARSDDQRVTRIGTFLRETHIDELPQLLNVLQGEMSIIGPRPERPEIASRIEKSLPGYRQRLALRPGLTGLAQVRLPADSDLEDVRRKLAHDIYYVRQLNPWMDLRIALSTVFHLSALCLNATSKLLVKSYGQAVESEYAQQPSPPTSAPSALDARPVVTSSLSVNTA